MTNTPRIILTGKLRSGKSSVARHLFLEYGFIELSFGTKLKIIADELFEGTNVEAYASEPVYEALPGEPLDDGFISDYRKPRRRYQDVGQALRALDPDVWTRQVEQAMSVWEDVRSVKGIVVSDMRQPNEYEWAKRHGFVIIRVNANEDTRLERARKAGDAFSVEDLRHETEMHVDDFEADYDIWNDGADFDELKRQVDEVMVDIPRRVAEIRASADSGP